VTPLMAEPQVLAPDGSVVTPGPDVAQEEDAAPGAAVAATMAAPPPDAAPGPDVAQDTAPAPGPVKRAARTPRAQPRRVKGR
jgi:hypothetical protein